MGGAVAKPWKRGRCLDAVTAHHQAELRRMEREVTENVSRRLAVSREAAMTGRFGNSRGSESIADALCVFVQGAPPDLPAARRTAREATVRT